jgi:hypothetical protein
VGLCQGRVQLDRAEGRLLGPGHRLLGRIAVDRRLRETDVCAREGGISRDRLLEERDRLLRRPTELLVLVVPSPQVRLVGLRIDAPRAPGKSRHLETDLASDRLRQLALQREHVAQVSLVLLGPEALVGGGADQLGRDRHAVASAQHGAFDDRVHVQRLSDLRQRLARVLELHHGGPRDHAHRADLGEVADQGVRHPVGEDLLRRVVAQVRERKHGERADGGRRGRGKGGLPPLREERGESQDRGDASRGGEVSRAPSWPRRRRSHGDGHGPLIAVRLHGGDEAVALPRQGLDVSRRARRIAEGFAQLVDRGVQAVVEVDVGVRGPEPQAQVVAGDDVPRPLEEDGQHGEGLAQQPDLDPLSMQLAGGEIGLEDSETDSAHHGRRHSVVLRPSSVNVQRESFPVTCHGKSLHALKLGDEPSFDAEMTRRALSRAPPGGRLGGVRRAAVLLFPGAGGAGGRGEGPGGRLRDQSRS